MPSALTARWPFYTDGFVPPPGWVRIPQGAGTTFVRHGCETDFVAGTSPANQALLTDLMSKHVCGRLTRSNL